MNLSMQSTNVVADISFVEFGLKKEKGGISAAVGIPWPCPEFLPTARTADCLLWVL